MRTMCENIVQRVSMITFKNYELCAMVLFFKPDNKNKLFFLFASSIRLKNKK